jgi:glyoxylase-like metal-dependent hydrolase (beta-lactamase superfamily II)
MALIASIPGVRGAQAYLYEGSDGLAVIDPGYTGSHGAVLRCISEYGRTAADLRWVILTHHHVDHGGTALALCQATGARLALHADDAPYLVPGRPRERMTGWGLIDVIPAGLAQYLMTCAMCETTRLHEGDTIAGLRVIHAPGHTPGSICLLAPVESALFLGDVLNNQHGLARPPWTVNNDHRRAREAPLRLSGLSFDRAYFGHGRPLLHGASALIAEYLARRSHLQ